MPYPSSTLSPGSALYPGATVASVEPVAPRVLTPTARRMMGTLPSYYWGNPVVERYIQGWANEIDRTDAYLDALERGLNPALTDDQYGLLSEWEREFQLPVAPPDATVPQRLGKLSAALRKLDAASSRDWVNALNAAVGAMWSYARNTPDQLADTITIPFDPGSYTAGQVQEVALKLHPAHRQLFMHYTVGFPLDVGRTDVDVF